MRRPILIRLAVVPGLVLAMAGLPGTAQAAVPLAPTVTNVSPKSPSSDLMPQFSGYTFSRTDAVRLYDNATCSGTPLAIATIRDYGSSLNYYWYAKVRVEPGSTTDVYANASGPSGTSPCSSVRTEGGHQIYKNTASVPFQTKLTAKPGKVVRTTGKRAKVKFQFKAVSSGRRSARAAERTTYYCSMDGKAQRRCTSGVTYKVKRGKHTFGVAASKGGVIDPTPATFTFKVKKK